MQKTPPTRLACLFFDFDGTILDTETPELHSWQEVYAQFDQEISLTLWYKNLGLGHDAPFNPYTYLENVTGKPIDQDQIRTKRRARFAELLAKEPPRPGIVDVLERATAQNIPALCVSSSPHAWVDGHLERIGLAHFFQKTICLEDAPRSKPYPDLYEVALQWAGVISSESIAIEDTKNGIAAAQGAGIFTLAYPNPVTIHLDLSAADGHITDAKEILTYLPLCSKVRKGNYHNH
jgi:HAD superfamily hydrolase (TIGR01509 family)